MITVTTPNVGQRIIRYLGVVNGEAVIRSGFSAASRGFFLGRSDVYEQKLREAKEIALKQMEKRAETLGANAVVGINWTIQAIPERFLIVGIKLLMVGVCGTAVNFEE